MESINANLNDIKKLSDKIGFSRNSIKYSVSMAHVRTSSRLQWVGSFTFCENPNKSNTRLNAVLILSFSSTWINSSTVIILPKLSTKETVRRRKS